MFAVVWPMPARAIAVRGVMSLVLLLGGIELACAQTGIFSNFQRRDVRPNLADALEDHDEWVATGRPMSIGPSEERLNALKPVLGPVPPRRITPVERPQEQPSAEPLVAEPAPVPSEPPRMIETDPGRIAHAPLPDRALVPGPPQQVTPQEIEAEEAQAPLPPQMEKQTEHVDIACLKPELTRIIEATGKHFGAKPVITSGQRQRGRRGSYHRRCMAADFFVPGVERSDLARYLRRLSQAGGVGTYCHTKSVHLDIGEPRNWYQCGRRFRFSQR